MNMTSFYLQFPNFLITKLIQLASNKMNNLYQGGQCNPNAIGASSNQYKNMMNVMTVGNQNPQRVIDHTQQAKSFQQEIKNREMMFKNMNQGWSQSKNQFKNAQMQNNAMLNGQFNQSMLQQQQYERQMHMMQQMQWMKGQEHLKMQQMMMNKQFQMIKLQQDAQNWQNQALMQDAFKTAQMTYDQQQNNILNSSSSMLDVMMNDPDPRFQNSQFLNFLRRIQKGDVVITGKQIKQVRPDEKSMESAFSQAQKTQKQNQMKMQAQFDQSKLLEQIQHQKTQKNLQENWAQKLQDYQKQYADSANFQKLLQQKYMQVLKEMNIDLTEAWQSASDLQQQLVHGDLKSQYIFQKNNPYIDVAFPKGLALQLINKGRNNQAILALESHIQKDMDDGESWRILGRILQQNDQDQKSVPCFMNALKANPKNLDCLLSLGISCTNILDQVKAMNYLKQWLTLNPKYQSLKFDPNVIPQDLVNLPTYKIDDIKRMNQDLINVFDQAMKMNSNDPELCSAMAILFFIKRQYEVSIDLFNKALSLDPTNYLLMNKVGATLAHLGRADDAIHFYHKALDIRPNYVRVWVNLGIAHAFKGMYNQAARFYLNALSFRPDAKHVWSYLHTCFMSLQRYDLINKIASQDPKAFIDFETLDLEQLPEPQIPYKITTQKHILNKLSQDWLKQSKKV